MVNGFTTKKISISLSRVNIYDILRFVTLYERLTKNKSLFYVQGHPLKTELILTSTLPRRF